MIKRKRHRHTSTTQDDNHGEEEDDDSWRLVLDRDDSATNTSNRRNNNQSAPSYCLFYTYYAPTLSFILTVCILLGILLGLSVSKTMSKLSLLRCITLLPVGLSLYVGLIRRRRLGQPWFRSILPLTLPLTVACSQVPLFMAAAIAAAAVLLFSFVTLPHPDGSSIMPDTTSSSSSSSSLSSPSFSSRQASSPVPVLMATFLLVTVMLTENFMIWVVSATFAAGQTTATAPPPLQDNGQRILLLYLLNGLSRQQVISLRRMWNVQWSLVSGLGAAFVVTDVFLHPKRQLYNLGVRAVLTLAAARFCRTVSFCLTVLPSQHPNCYQQHYPYPPPTAWNEWVWVGLLPASHGGCNDLIISGHATVTSTLACVVASVADDAWFSAAVWTMIALDYLIEIYEGFHYSVDMWLGFVTVSLLWRVLEPWERCGKNRSSPPPADDDSASTHKNDEAGVTRMIPLSKPPPPAHQAVLYSFPCFLAYLQLVVFPKWSANFLIVGYILFVVGIFVRFVWKQPQSHKRVVALHFGQHTVLCLLYMALGVYL